VWYVDAQMIHYLEDWIVDSDQIQSDVTTTFLNKFINFQQTCCQFSYRLAGGSEERANALFGNIIASVSGSDSKLKEAVNSFWSKR
jgi:exocyst complex component 2